MSKPFLVVGAGFTGAVIARQLAEAGHLVLVIDKADHVAGHAHTVRDKETGIMQHVYGPHIFNTDDEEVWQYVNRFAEMQPFLHRVKAINSHGVFSFPINLHTINQFFGKEFNPQEARDFIRARQVKFALEPNNFEEKALSMVGAALYEAFFRDYTRKQWGRDPRSIPASVLTRLPLRFNYNDNYYNVRFQGIPLEGYTSLVEKILDHRYIKVELKNPFDRLREGFEHTFYSGPIDEFFNHKYGMLSYRTLRFGRIDSHKLSDIQGTAVINYTDDMRAFTRITEDKHFAPWETHETSVAHAEYSEEMRLGGVPFYPVRTERDLSILKVYEEEAATLPAVTFCGRLGQYRYHDMDDVIRAGLDIARAFLKER